MGLDSVEIIVGVENAFQIRIPDRVAVKIFTPRNFIMYVSSVIKIQPSQYCETQRIFNSLRALFPQLRAWFKPSTKLFDVLQMKSWAVIRSELSIHCPEDLPRNLFGFELRSVRDLVFWIAEQQLPMQSGLWTRETVTLTIRSVIQKVLG